jgi:ribonuclease-3
MIPEKKKLSVFEKKIGYTFNNKNILIQALSHSSFAYENPQDNPSDNEVMEFLGDSVLGFILADYLCQSYPELSEGELSKLKSQAASTTALFTFAKNIKLDKYVLLGKGEEKSGGRNKKTILAGAFEALIAAIYQDSGITDARNLLLSQVQSLFKKINVDKFLINNYKSALQEYLQKATLPAPRYKTVTSRGPNHKMSFTVEVFSEKKSLASAKGSSKKNAEQKAAQKALKSLLGRKIKAFNSDTFLLKKKIKT